MDNCIEEITNSLYKIEDPGQLSNVHRWVVKLTTGDPTGLKADYLRLLEYTLKSDNFREPFDGPPPDGRLPGLNELVRRPSSPTPYCPEKRTRCALAAGGSGIRGEVRRGEVRRDAGCPGNGGDDADACPELASLIAQTNSNTASLQKFMADAQRYTCDGGRLMVQVCGQLMDDYLRSAEAVFDDRAQKLGDALAKEQVALLLRYRTAGMRVISRAQILLDHARELMPAFIYSEYVVEPDAYMKRIVLEKRSAVSGTGPDDNNGADGGLSDLEQKKLMSALIWLRSEVDRADCENVSLVDRYETVVAAIDATNRKRTDNECLAKTRRNELRAQLDCLRKKSAEQVALIDSYVAKISSEKSESVPSCA